ncbi:MAG: tRNA (N6-threonylcarbamoyladenosine(37)-N6)-methyltransferase TrmO [Candidatus Sabulitectum sp.]|nr:tRNA (N6-threonylcarbamoyladenosine(37)-N6)-methyltransferase TrmO [Candidatus Sabulitectum sp.]
MEIVYNSIGVIHTPYIEMAPFQALEDDTNGPFILELKKKYASGLKDLDKYKYLMVFFHIHKSKGYNGSNLAHPPSMNGGSTGLFASRSPNRPNTIGVDVARILKIKGNKVFTSGLSALNGTPLLDIKPYLTVDRKELD